MGIFRLIDKGERDDTILAVPHTNLLSAEYHDLEDVPKHFLEEVAPFFRVYNGPEIVEVEAKGWG